MNLDTLFAIFCIVAPCGVTTSIVTPHFDTSVVTPRIVTLNYVTCIVTPCNLKAYLDILFLAPCTVTLCIVTR